MHEGLSRYDSYLSSDVPKLSYLSSDVPKLWDLWLFDSKVDRTWDAGAKIIKSMKNWRKLYQNLIQNLSKMGPKSRENHEHRWLEALLDHLWHISGSKVVPGSILGRFGEAFWLHFGGNCREKTDFRRCDFFIIFWKTFFKDLNGCWSSFSWLLSSKTVSETEKAKRWTTYVLLKENLCFWGCRPLFFGIKTMKKRSRNTEGIRRWLFNDFRWILNSIWSSKIDKNQ